MRGSSNFMKHFLQDFFQNYETQKWQPLDLDGKRDDPLYPSNSASTGLVFIADVDYTFIWLSLLSHKYNYFLHLSKSEQTSINTFIYDEHPKHLISVYEYQYIYILVLLLKIQPKTKKAESIMAFLAGGVRISIRSID